MNGLYEASDKCTRWSTWYILLVDSHNVDVTVLDSIPGDERGLVI